MITEFFYGSGAIVTNWLALNGERYWFSGDGAMKTGWQVAVSGVGIMYVY